MAEETLDLDVRTPAEWAEDHLEWKGRSITRPCHPAEPGVGAIP